MKTKDLTLEELKAFIKEHEDDILEVVPMKDPDHGRDFGPDCYKNIYLLEDKLFALYFIENYPVCKKTWTFKEEDLNHYELLEVKAKEITTTEYHLVDP